MTSPPRSAEPPPTLRLSALLGSAAIGTGARRIGRVSDLLVTLDDSHPAAVAVLLRGRSRPIRLAATATTGDRRLHVAEDDATPVPEGDLLRLARDVLDTQIVDVRGRRLVRVGDVELAPHGGALRVVAVDVGLGSVLRRLGLGRLSDHAPRDALDWTQLHLASGRGHALQLASPAAAVHHLGADELAELVARLPPARGSEVLQAVAEEHTGATRSRAAHHHRRHRFPHAARRRART